MAKSIRLKTDTQRRVEGAVKQFKEVTRAEMSDAAMVDLLVNEALDAGLVPPLRRKGERGRP